LSVISINIWNFWRGEEMLSVAADSGIDVFPGELKNGLQDTQFVLEMLDELGLARAGKTTDGRRRSRLVPMFAKSAFAIP